MNIRKRSIVTLLLVAIMSLGCIGSAFAAASDYGPAFDSDLKSGSSRTTEVPYGPAFSNSQPSSPSVVLQDSPSPSSPAESDSGYTLHSSLGAPHRTPRLQTTILMADTLQWSGPFVNDQTISVDNRPFCAMSTFLEDIVGNFLYRTYTSSNGWTNWAMNGGQTTLPGNLAPVEAIQCRFSGPVNNDYDIYYMAYLNNGQQTGWAKNGETAGTMGRGLYMTGYRLAFYPKGSSPRLNTGGTLISNHQDGVQYVNGSLRYINGDGSNHTGWGWRGNDRYYFVDSWPVTGWQYIDGYKYYFNGDGRLVSDVEYLVGSGGPFQLKINKEMNCLTVYAQDGANGFIIPVKSFLTSTGDDTPLGTFYIPEKYRWRLMINDVHTQYATRLGAGLPFLMHSIIYDAPNPYTMWASTYNQLGVARSAGCIRLTTADSKWIYDHCPVGTAVTVYNSPIPGPFERPTIAEEIAFEQTWDPTDPDVTAEGIAAETARIQGR